VIIGALVVSAAVMIQVFGMSKSKEACCPSRMLNYQLQLCAGYSLCLKNCGQLLLEATGP